MMKVFIANDKHEALKKIGFHQQVEDYSLCGVNGVVVEDKSFYLFASMHLDSNTDFRLEDTVNDNIKKLIINVVLDEDDEEAEEPEYNAEQNKKEAINKAMAAFWGEMDMEEFDADSEDICELLKEFQNRVVEDLSEWL